MDAYFVVEYDKDAKDPVVKQTYRFLRVTDLLKWLSENKDAKIVVYEAKCLMDWS